MTSKLNKNKLHCIWEFLTLAKFRKTKPLVKVLRLQGVIGKLGVGKNGMTLEGLNESIEKAFENTSIGAVCLIINSPGGSPVQSEFIAQRIIDLAKAKSIPVYSFVEDVAASGGYWLACAGDEIYVSKSSIIGSIGVISAGFGLTEVIKKIGIERRVITQGINKSILDPFMPMKNSDVQIITELQKEAHTHFINYVKTRRKDRLKESDEKLFNGEFWSGNTAKDFGLVDGIDTLYNFLERKFGKDIRIEHIKAKESWFKKKLMASLKTEDIVDGLYSKLENELISSKFKLY